MGRMMGRAGHGRGIGLALVLALGLALALAGLVVGLGQPGTALAQPTGTTVTCTNDSPADQSSLQSALNAAPTDGTLYTITLSPNCTINLASSLEVGANVNITIDGNGLTLVGNGTSTAGGTFDDLDVADAPTTLALSQVTVERGARGISTHGGTVDSVVLIDSAVSDNASDGIIAATATVTNSTISDNAAHGISASAVTVTNSTISDNGSDGIDAFNATASNSTISGNEGVGIFPVHSATLTASILAGNTGGNCFLPSPGATITDGGYNLSTNDSCGFSTANHSQNDASATGTGGLNLADSGNLANYGGPTQTIALGPGSIAIDAIPVNSQGQCLNAAGTPIDYPGTTTPITTDQRGIDRPQGAKCDIGAYEAPALSLTVTPAQPNSHGWYTTDPTVTLGYGGLAIGADTNGVAQPQIAACTGLTGLTHTAQQLNDTGSVEATVTQDGSYSITSCGVSQGTTALGVSYSGLSLPFDLKVDTTPPTITSPVPDGSYLLHAQVPLTCNDTGSGVATCAVTVKEPNGTAMTVELGDDVPTGQTGSYTVTPTSVTDNAGNADTTVFHYTVSYQFTTLPGSTTTVNRGYYALIRFAPEDANGKDYASRTLPVTSVELVGDGQTIPFVHQFQFATFDGMPGYQLILNTRNLAPGTWRLEVQVGSGSTTADGWITFTVTG